MRRNRRQMVDEFRAYWKYYVFQSLFATVVVFIVLLALGIQKNPVIIASIGATAFIVCSMPNSPSGQSRNIIGGYIIGLICGKLCALIPYPDFLPEHISFSILLAVAAGLSMFIMVITDTEHPPASGMAIGVALKRAFSWEVIAAVLISALVLSMIHFIFKKYLKDLT